MIQQLQQRSNLMNSEKRVGLLSLANMKVLIIAPYPPNEAPSQRFRFEQYLSYLEQHDIQFKYSPFWNLTTWKILYKKGNQFYKMSGLLMGFIRRFMLMFTIGQYHFIWLHREAAPIGPPVFEWMICKLWRKKIIYDFDDAIWLNNVSTVNSFAGKLKWHGKVKSICKWSWKVTCGNNYLCQYAGEQRGSSKYVLCLPTTIDTKVYKLKFVSPHKLTIGWTGSQSTVAYLQMVIAPLQQLQTEIDFDVVVISNLDAQLPLKNYRFVQWQQNSEVQDLSQIDIGLMPLTDDEWAQGKCGFKLLQYMAMGILSVASPVGVNEFILDNEQAGFIAQNEVAWKNALRKLLSDEKLRKQMGEFGKQRLQNFYSVDSQKENYLHLFQKN